MPKNTDDNGYDPVLVEAFYQDLKTGEINPTEFRTQLRRTGTIRAFNAALDRFLTEVVNGEL